jgi:hypothetical protein
LFHSSSHGPNGGRGGPNVDVCQPESDAQGDSANDEDGDREGLPRCRPDEAEDRHEHQAGDGDSASEQPDEDCPAGQSENGSLAGCSGFECTRSNRAECELAEQVAESARGDTAESHGEQNFRNSVGVDDSVHGREGDERGRPQDGLHSGQSPRPAQRRALILLCRWVILGGPSKIPHQPFGAPQKSDEKDTPDEDGHGNEVDPCEFGVDDLGSGNHESDEHDRQYRSDQVCDQEGRGE